MKIYNQKNDLISRSNHGRLRQIKAVIPAVRQNYKILVYGLER